MTANAYDKWKSEVFAKEFFHDTFELQRKARVEATISGSFDPLADDPIQQALRVLDAQKRIEVVPALKMPAASSKSWLEKVGLFSARKPDAEKLAQENKEEQKPGRKNQ